jgi:hypothetical protein
MRKWKTTTDFVSGTGLERSVGTSHKTFKLKEVGEIIRLDRERSAQQGLPKRKLNPITAYVLDFIIDQFLLDSSREGSILQKITIEDSKENGL